MFKMMKVFDCQSMSKDVRDVFFSRQEGGCNDCYVAWTVQPYYTEDGRNEEYCKVDEWLIQNGADTDEVVLINHWW